MLTKIKLKIKQKQLYLFKLQQPYLKLVFLLSYITLEIFLLNLLKNLLYIQFLSFFLNQL